MSWKKSGDGKWTGNTQTEDSDQLKTSNYSQLTLMKGNHMIPVPYSFYHT